MEFHSSCLKEKINEKSGEQHVLFVLVLLFLSSSLIGQTRKDVVWDIVRKNDYILGAGVMNQSSYFPSPEGFGAYGNAGLNTSFSWGSGDAIIDSSAHYGLQWIGRGSNLSDLRSQYDQFAGGVAASYIDEPSYKQFPAIGNFHKLAREAVPEVIHFSTLLPSYASSSSKIEGEDWKKHIDDYINITNPDALIWDFYPYGSGLCAGVFLFQPRFNESFYSDMAYIREKGLAANIPYGGWLSAFGRTCPSNGEDFGFRYPSESDFRYHAFAQLAFGSHIMIYFNYATSSSAEGFPSSGFIEQDGSEKSIYSWSQKLSPWIRNIGNELNLMTNTGLSWVTRTAPAPNSIPLWSEGAGGNDDIESISLPLLSERENENGLVGFFDGANGSKGKAILIVNTNQAGNRNADGLKADIRIKMAIGKKLWRMDKSTGIVSEVSLNSSREYTFQLPRGTGELLYTELPDYDEDGIANWYERYHKLNHMSAVNAHQDPDGDCFTNLQEYQNGTNPNIFDIEVGMCDNFDIELTPKGKFSLDSADWFYKREYFGNPVSIGKYSMSIERYPIGENTKDISLSASIIKYASPYQSIDKNTKDGMFVGARHYKVKRNSGKADGLVYVRLYYNISDSLDVMSVAQDHVVQSGASYISPYMWLIFDETYTTADVSPLGISGLKGAGKIIGVGKESGVPYVELALDFRGSEQGYTIVPALWVTNRKKDSYSPPKGTIRYSAKEDKFQGWDGTRWVDFN